VAELVDAFFKQALEECVFVGGLGIEFGAQTMDGDDGAALGGGRASEDKLV
jgi:hypothetical protein